MGGSAEDLSAGERDAGRLATTIAEAVATAGGSDGELDTTEIDGLAAGGADETAGES